jgi:hypothetical protein
MADWRRRTGRIITDSQGQTGAIAVTVKKAGTSTLVTLKANKAGTEAQTNPFDTNAYGVWTFFVDVDTLVSCDYELDISFSKSGYGFDVMNEMWENHSMIGALTAGQVLESDFDATTLLYATADNTPVATTPTEFMVVLTSAAPNQLVDHSAVTIATGNGLSGGGTIAANRTLSIGPGTGIVVSSTTVGVTGVLADLFALTPPASDGQFIVATGGGAFQYESGATVRTSVGVGTGDSPTFTGLTLSGLTSGRVVLAGTAGVLEDSANLAFSDSLLTVIGALTVGVDDTGHDVIFYGASSGAFFKFDQANDMGILRGPLVTPGILTLQTAETSVVDGDKLGRIDFQAPLDAAGTDAILVAASIWAEAGDTFAVDNNSTDIVFATAISGAVTETMRITHDGNLVATADLDIGAHDFRAQNLTADALTAGRVVFTGASGLLSADEAFLWDDTLKTLSVATATKTSGGSLSGFNAVATVGTGWDDGRVYGFAGTATMIDSSGYVNAQAIGVRGRASYKSSGHCDELVGMKGSIYITTSDASGTIDKAITIWASGIFKDGSAASTPANSYGLYIDPVAVGTVTWGIYQEAAADKNYFGGNVGIGIETFGTNAAEVWSQGHGTAPTTSIADSYQIWSADVNAAAGYGWMHGRDEKGHTLIIAGVVIKVDGGQTANPHEGLIEINTNENKVYMYADAGWREMATW